MGIKKLKFWEAAKLIEEGGKIRIQTKENKVAMDSEEYNEALKGMIEKLSEGVEYFAIEKTELCRKKPRKITTKDIDDLGVTNVSDFGYLLVEDKVESEEFSRAVSSYEIDKNVEFIGFTPVSSAGTVKLMFRENK